MVDWGALFRFASDEAPAKDPAVLQHPPTITPVDPFVGFTVEQEDRPAVYHEDEPGPGPGVFQPPAYGVPGPIPGPGAVRPITPVVGPRPPMQGPVTHRPYYPSQPSGVVSTPTPERPVQHPPAYTPAGDPVFDARQNVIEACKHLLQAEEHLFRAERRCPDCVQKHLLLAQGYADELRSLDPSNRWYNEGRLIIRVTNGAIAMLESKQYTPDQVADQIRRSRKACLQATRSFKLERASHLRALVTKRNLALAGGAVAAYLLLRR